MRWPGRSRARQRSTAARAIGFPARKLDPSSSPLAPAQPCACAQATVFGPEAIASTQPIPPHAQGSSNPATSTWPM